MPLPRWDQVPLWGSIGWGALVLINDYAYLAAGLEVPLNGQLGVTGGDGSHHGRFFLFAGFGGYV